MYEAELLADCVAEATGQPEDDLPDLIRACQILLASERSLPRPGPQLQDWATGRITQSDLTGTLRHYKALLEDHNRRIDYFLEWTPWLMHLDAVISPELATATLALIEAQNHMHGAKPKQEVEQAACKRLTAARRALTMSILTAERT